MKTTRTNQYPHWQRLEHRLFAPGVSWGWVDKCIVLVFQCVSSACWTEMPFWKQIPLYISVIYPMPVIRAIAETISCGSQVTEPVLIHRGVAGQKEFKQACSSRLFYCIVTWGRGRVCTSHMGRSEDNIGKSVFSFHHGIKDWTHIAQLTQRTCTCEATSAPDTQLLVMPWDRTKKFQLFPRFHRSKESCGKTKPEKEFQQPALF